MKKIVLFAAAAFAGIIAFTSCQKEQISTATPVVVDHTSGDRAPFIYGVSLFTANNPSQLVTMDAANGLIVASFQVYVLDALGNQVFLTDLKGVCNGPDGRVWVTTGLNNPADVYKNALMKVNAQTGQASIVSYSPANIGTVSDLDYNPDNNTFYGLRNNGNSLVTITDNNNNYGTYAAVNITNLGVSYVAKGLSLVRDQAGVRIMVAANRNNIAFPCRLFTVPAAGNATLFTDVLPNNQLATSHCGIGWDADLFQMLINRQVTAGAGLNSVVWNPFPPAQSQSDFWGGDTVNFEDVSSDIN